MSRARHADGDALADALATAPFVRVLAGRDGDSLAAAGLLARACRARDVPFQVRALDPLDSTLGPAVTEDAVTVAVGLAAGGDDGDAETAVDAGTVDADTVDADAVDAVLADRPASPVAYETARTLGTDPDPLLALAGTVAAGERPRAAGGALQAAEATETVRRRPGVAVPTTDLADGLAHTTLLHGPASGDEARARETLDELELPEELDDDDHRRVASVVAIDVATADGATPRAARAVERALRPYATPGGPFETVGGHADVLDAVARAAPGVAVPLALGADVRDRALEAWRAHADAAHRLLREAEVARHGGLSVARVGGGAGAAGDDDVAPAVLPTVARLFRDFRAPEDVAAVVADGAAAVASVEDAGLGGALADAARSVDGAGRGTARAGIARFDEGASHADQFTDALREALR